MKRRVLAKILCGAMILSILGTPNLYKTAQNEEASTDRFDVSDHREKLNYRDL